MLPAVTDFLGAASARATRDGAGAVHPGPGRRALPDRERLPCGAGAVADERRLRRTPPAYAAGEDFLLYPPTIQPWGYRIVDRLFAHRVIPRGTPRPWPRGAEIAAALEVDGFMERNFLAGLLVIKDGAIRLERYGLGLGEADRWTTMSTVKSLTAVLVGAAIRDGAIGSVAAPVTHFLSELRGTAYDGVTLEHLMTMSSGTAWTEVYSDPDCDVNRYSRSLADRVPGGVLRLMAGLRRQQRRAAPSCTTPATPSCSAPA